jgi:hypothetical protein|tara:strand:- start:1639 stop:2010 length:372 start_codon:yes stop_codon:yes gene_type:complete
MAAPTLDGIGLGKLQGISNELNGNIIPLPMPGDDSSGTETFDMLGVTRTISLSGVFVGTTAQIITAVNNLEALINGDQSASVDLVVDEFGETYQVKVASMSTNWEVSGVSLRCQYRIMLIQGG